MSTTQAKTQPIGKEKRVSSPSIRSQPRTVTKTTTNASKPVSIAAPRTTKPTTTASRPSSTVSPKPTNATTLKSTNSLNKDKRLPSSTTCSVEKPPPLNRKGSLNNATPSVRIQRSLSTAKTVGDHKLVQPKSAPSLKTLDKNVTKSKTSNLRSSRSLSANRKPKEETESETEREEIIYQDNQEVAVADEHCNHHDDLNVDNQEVSVDDERCNHHDDLNIDACRDETKHEQEQDETEIHNEMNKEQINIENQNHDCDENELKECENKTETKEDKALEEEESFLKASEIRRRMEAQSGSDEAVTPRVVVRGGSWPVNKKEVAAPVSNELIEETTNKLIKENKKNRVLAMVGAFETVMSNQ